MNTIFKLLCLCGALVATSNIAQAEQNRTMLRYIEVVGTGEVSVSPDRANITLHVMAVKHSTAAAKKDVDRASKRIFSTAKAFGITPKDIDAASLSSSPQYEWRKEGRQYLGEQVQRTIELTLRDLTKLAPLTDNLVRLEGVQIRSNQLSYSKRVQARHTAFANAVKDAKEKAYATLKPLGIGLGEVLSIHEANASQPFPAYYESKQISVMSDSREVPAPMFVKDQRIRTQATVRFALSKPE